MIEPFIFLDPPYVPVSEYADFKRYTKEQFSVQDHKNLASEVHRLYELGCYVIVTNSDHPLVQELYKDFSLKIVDTRRSISSKASSRKSKDIIVTAFPPDLSLSTSVPILSEQVSKFPPTRFMGSKNKLLPQIWAAVSQFQFHSVLDLFSGSGAVSYMFKAMGKSVTSNDYMAMATTFSKAMIENNHTTLDLSIAHQLMKKKHASDHFVQTRFHGLYYSDEDNDFIDTLRLNIWQLSDPYQRAIAMTALIRACIKKRPRGIFTYTGYRYDDGRRDLKIPFSQQFLEAVDSINASIFDNGEKNSALHGDALSIPASSPDLVYIDPPYYSPFSDNEYVRRYHFVEGLARDWKGVDIQEHTKTKKFKSYPTPFSSRTGAASAFDQVFSKYRNSILLVSYSSNSLPTRDEMLALLKKYKQHTMVIPIDYTYSFGNQKSAKTHRYNVQEYLFLGY